MIWFSLVLLLIGEQLTDAGRIDWSVEKPSAFWYEQARLSIDEALQRRDNTRLAKNVILFLGDGMGVSTVTAGRIRKGQMKGQLGEDFLTEMEQFSHLGLSKTYVLPWSSFGNGGREGNCSGTISIIKRQTQQPRPQPFSAESKHSSARSASMDVLSAAIVPAL